MTDHRERATTEQHRDSNLAKLTPCHVVDGIVMAAPMPGGSSDKAYMWDAEKEFPVRVGPVSDFDQQVFDTFHTYGYYGLFKPDMHEVASQLPRIAQPAYVMTHPVSVDPSQVLRDVNSIRRHRGRTTVFTPRPCTT